jgi:Protein of unknown function (DUF1549)/Protein of unknown function (DUF1553)/Planctomycete cytochrome C
MKPKMNARLFSNQLRRLLAWSGAFLALAAIAQDQPRDPLANPGALKAAIAKTQPKAKNKDIPPDQLEFFETKIRPVLAENCYECHSEETGKAINDLALDTRDGIRTGGERGPGVVPGDPAASLLLRAIQQQGQLHMPPARKGPKLADNIIADFQKWIEMGAPDPRDAAKLAKADEAPKPEKVYDWDKEREYWAFQKPKAAAPPAVKDTKWPQSDIDRFVLAKEEQKGLKPVADADKRTLGRRVYYDLTGLPPSPEELDAFVKDRSSDAYEKLVDKLLASPRFGEQWGRHWLDVARYGESTGLDRNLNFPYAWRYRNYVIDSFNQDKPYNLFIKEQLAGDLLPAKDQKEKDVHTIATGFLAIGPKGLNETRIRYLKWQVVDDQIDTTTRGFLGLTVSCARCHDHKFDPIPTKDYHALAGIFSSTDVLYGTVAGRGNRRPTELAGLEGTNNRPILNGGGPTPNMFVNTNRNFGALGGTNGGVAGGGGGFGGGGRRGRNGGGTNAFAVATNLLADGTNFIVAGTNTLDGTNTLALNGRGGRGGRGGGGAGAGFGGGRRGRGTNDGPVERVPAHGPYAMAAKDVTPVDSPVYYRGDLAKPKDTVPRGYLRIINEPTAAPPPEDSSGRLELADWITSPENPLTARVVVNRAWQQLFGAGIVTTPDNFGHLGAQPSHQELLDYLAVKFVNQQNWSVKQLVRSLVLTRTYRLSSETDSKTRDIDPANVLLSHASVRRIGAESIRDTMLAASGDLDLDPPKGSITADFGDGYYGVNIWPTDFPDDYRKRSIYLPVPRDVVPESLSLFDFPNPSLISARREDTISPSQALFLMNNPFVQTESLRLAQRVLQNAKLSDNERVKEAYRRALLREPTSAEVTRALGYIKAQSQLLASAPAASGTLVAAKIEASANSDVPSESGEADLKVSIGSSAVRPDGKPSEVYVRTIHDYEATKPANPREAAWTLFTQALFAGAEFRYLQ